MKMYSMNFGWEGMAVVIADTIEEAADLMVKNHYAASEIGAQRLADGLHLTEHPIKAGTVVINLGDS